MKQGIRKSWGNPVLTMAVTVEMRKVDWGYILKWKLQGKWVESLQSSPGKPF